MKLRITGKTIGQLIAVALLSAGVAQAKEVVDMIGRKVILPDVITKAYAPSPYGSTMLYSVAPDKLAGLMSPIREGDRKFFSPIVHHLPVLGGLNQPSRIAEAKPDVIIVWGDKHNPIHQPSEEAMKKLGLPYVYVVVGDLADLPDYPAAYEFLGRLLGKEEHAAKEAAWCKKALADTAAVIRRVPANQRPKVYLAEGPDGLQTEYDDSLHVHLLKLAGDVNVRRGHTTCHKGFEPVKLEEVKAWNPDVIFVQDKGFFDKVLGDPAWQGIQAVKEKRVFLIPKKPFNWFDRPPSFMRILGLKWVMSCLYPKQYKVDMVAETQDFFRLFIGVDISPEDARAIMHL